jgi:hypothetical protein
MRTCLGASLELQSASMVPPAWADNCALLHCEGYCLYRPHLAAEMMRAAKKAGALVSMDLASFEVRVLPAAGQRLAAGCSALQRCTFCAVARCTMSSMPAPGTDSLASLAKHYKRRYKSIRQSHEPEQQQCVARCFITLWHIAPPQPF